MNEEKKYFPKGLYVKKPNEKAPDYVIGAISVHVADFKEYLEQVSGEWLNMDIKNSKEGKFYAEVNLWKPDASKAPDAVPPAPDPTPTAAVEPVAKEEDGVNSLPF